MEKYKKKKLNFMGFSREVRVSERENQRSRCRQDRFSIIRNLDEESIEEKQVNSRIPTIGFSSKPKDQASSRLAMLQKWKQEKMVKKQQESKLKKPVFKVGVIQSSPAACLGSKPLFALDTSSRLYKSSFKMSNSQLFGKKQESANASDTKTSAKMSNLQLSGKKQESTNASDTKTGAKVFKSQTSAKKPVVDMVSIKTTAKDMKIQPSTSKIGVPGKPDFKWSRNKDSVIQSISTKPKVDTKPNIVKKSDFLLMDQLPTGRKQPTIGSKPPLETKKESRLQPLNVRSKVTSAAKDVKCNIPSSGLPKATASRTLSKEPIKAIPRKNDAVKSIPKFSKNITSRQKDNISEKTSRSVSKVPTKPDNHNLLREPEKAATFECELSHIEPVKEQRKSFAPPGFMFQAPAELNSSLFLEDGPSAIFLRMKNQFLRTSTPKQSPSNQKSSFETKDSECLENENTKSPKDENIQYLKEEEKNEDPQCSNNEGNKLGSSHKCDPEALLSSSLESIYLNGVKPVHPKQSLKFEYPEVVSTENEEEVLLSSKIIHPEHSLALESTPGGAIHSPILPVSVEIDKTEINSTDTNPADDRKITVPFPEDDSVFCDSIPDPTHIAQPTDFKQFLELELPVVISTKNQEELLSSSKITNCKHSLATESPLGGTIIQPKLPDSLQIEKPGNGLKIPERKIRSFRQSEKPGLARINESVENTPASALKNKVLDSVFTPRRSLRLSKFSGNFSSLENLLDAPKPKEDKDIADLKRNWTPRRSLRLSKFSTEFSSAENLFNIRRPTLYSSPEKDEAVPKMNSRVTYDFDGLLSEENICPSTTRGGKVSLLYTPPNKSRASIMRPSIKGDLMSFSPKT